MNYDVIVIGAGNGGLSAGAKMALKGKKVLLLEKHNIPGGCGTSFRRGRFEFEVALHQLSSMGTVENPGPLRELFKEYGIEDKIDWVPINTLFNVKLPNNFSQSIPANRERAVEELSKTFPKERDNIKRYFDTVFKFAEEVEEVKAKQVESQSNPMEPGSLKKLMVQKLFKNKFPILAKYALRTTEDVLDEFFEDDRLKLSLSAYWCFMGVDPKEFPFSILAQCTAIYISDLPYYLKGGSQVMSQALADVIINNNGCVKYNTGAEEIVVKNNKALAVIDTDGNRYNAKKIISGISPIDTYFKLIKEEDRPKEIVDYFKPYEVGISALTCFIGLDCPPEEIGFTDSFNLIYDYTDDEAFRSSKELMPVKDPIIATCYTIDDPTVSPAGTSVITAGTLKYADPWIALSKDDYYDTKYEAANIIIDRLEGHFTGIRDHIEELEIGTPITHMRYLRHPKGSIYGFKQDVESSVFFFPRKDFIENLTSANGWVNTCGFGPNYMYASDVVDNILKEGDI